MISITGSLAILMLLFLLALWGYIAINRDYLANWLEVMVTRRRWRKHHGR